jgi:hypothetical protein
MTMHINVVNTRVVRIVTNDRNDIIEIIFLSLSFLRVAGVQRGTHGTYGVKHVITCQFLNFVQNAPRGIDAKRATWN